MMFTDLGSILAFTIFGLEKPHTLKTELQELRMSSYSAQLLALAQLHERPAYKWGYCMR